MERNIIGHQRCTFCRGTGKQQPSGWKCSVCGGTGKMPVYESPPEEASADNAPDGKIEDK